ncbi:MAG: aminodeoxychorismate/anthranilate synthase component II [Bacteroidales bacterium]
MRLLLLDNYDSYTYNLAHYLREHPGLSVDVISNDGITLEGVESYDAIVLSPGPGLPSDSGIMNALISRYAQEKPILGICLGMQAIAESFGAKLVHLGRVCHGEASRAVILDSQEILFRGLPSDTAVGRYHSWVVSRQGLPECLEVTALDDQGDIMAIRHRTYNLRGVQFHPESILTPLGKQMIGNWVNGL